MLISTNTLAQYATPISFWLNPQFTAPTAMSAGNYNQLNAHYQKQGLAGSLGSRSMILSGQLSLSNRRNAHYGTLGLNIMRQEVGASYLLATTGALLSYNYTVGLSSRHHLVGGVQAGYFSRGIDWSKVTTGSQIRDGEINPGLDHGEVYGSPKSSAFTTNIGLAYYLADALGGQRFHLGAGMINANKGRFTYLENDDNQAEPLRWIVYSKLRLISTPFYELATNMYWQQENKMQDVVAGLQLNKGINPRRTVAEEHLGLGLYFSPDKTGTLGLQLKRQSLLLGISYSMPFGNGELHGIQNAAEVTLGWRMQRASPRNAYYGSGRQSVGAAAFQGRQQRLSGNTVKRARTNKYKVNRKAARAYKARANKRPTVVTKQKFSKKVKAYKSRANRKSIFSRIFKRGNKPTYKAKKIKRWKPQRKRFQWLRKRRGY